MPSICSFYTAWLLAVFGFGLAMVAFATIYAVSHASSLVGSVGSHLKQRVVMAQRKHLYASDYLRQQTTGIVDRARMRIPRSLELLGKPRKMTCARGWA